MANHPNRSQLSAVMPDELVDLSLQKGARLLKFMQQATALGMTDGMLRQDVRLPGSLSQTLFPGGFREDGHLKPLIDGYLAGYKMGTCLTKT